MIYVYVKNGVVVDKAQIPPEKVFAEPYASQFIEAPDEVKLGWLHDGTTFTAPPAPVIPEVVTPPAPTREELMAQLAALSAQIQALE
jgi:hypothetical protein